MFLNIPTVVFLPLFLFQCFYDVCRDVCADDVAVFIFFLKEIEHNTAAGTDVHKGVARDIIRNGGFRAVCGIVHGLKILIFVVETVKFILAKAKHIKKDRNTFFIG